MSPAVSREALNADRTALRGLALIVLVSTATVLAALAFEHLGGYRACPLCLIERYAYYFAVAMGGLAWLVARAGLRWGVWVLPMLIAAGFLINAGLGIYHAGAEWKWWAGPSTCSGALGSLTDGGTGGAVAGGGDLLDLSKPVIRCDEAPWTLGGLSFAGWNAVLSTGLGVLAWQTAAACAARRRRAVPRLVAGAADEPRAEPAIDTQTETTVAHR